MEFPLLSLILFLPLVGGIVILLLGRESTAGRPIAIGIASVEVLLALVGYFAYSRSSGQTFQLVEQVPWIPGLGISYHLGVDGISLLLVFLTAVVSLMVVLFVVPPHDGREHIYYFWLLMLESTLMGVYSALDLILFYVFFEAMLIPTYFLIGGWGSARGQAAAIKFFLYTLFGSFLMLVAIIGVRVASGSNSFDFITLAKSPVAASLQTWFFLGFALAFAIKTPLFPFSSWLPDAYVEGPTSTSVMLASLMSKVGAYGFLRFCLGLFPDASRQFTPLIGTLAVITILYGAWSAITQRDLKGVISYSSLGHLGLIVLGIFALNASGVEGSLFLMVAHGISICALFLLVHAIEVRWGTREIGRLGGLQHPAPALAAVLLLALLSAMPLPGLNSFPGEFLILRGVFAGFPSYAYGVLAALGVVLAAAYVIWTYTRTAYYAPSAVVAEAHGGHVDLRGSDWLTFAPLVAIIFALGFLPGLVLVKTGPSATAIAQQAHGTAAQVPADSVRLVQSSTVIAR